MSKSSNRLIIKQSVKYFFIIIIFLTSIFLARTLWNLPQNVQLIGLISGVSILVISLIFDLLSVNDIIPIFKR